MVVIGTGYHLGIEEIRLSPIQRDRAVFHKSGAQLTYETDSTDTPWLTAGVQQGGADWGFALRSGGDAGGHEVDLWLDRVKQRLRIRVAAQDGAPLYDIDVERVDEAGGELRFCHAGESYGPTDTRHLDHGSWAKDGDTMNLEIDEGSDGTIDRSVRLADRG